MDYILFANVIKSIFNKIAIVSLLNNKKNYSQLEIAFIRGDSKIWATGIPIHGRARLLKGSPGQNIGDWSNVLKRTKIY